MSRFIAEKWDVDKFEFTVRDTKDNSAEQISIESMVEYVLNLDIQVEGVSCARTVEPTVAFIEVEIPDTEYKWYLFDLVNKCLYDENKEDSSRTEKVLSDEKVRSAIARTNPTRFAELSEDTEVTEDSEDFEAFEAEFDEIDISGDTEPAPEVMLEGDSEPAVSEIAEPVEEEVPKVKEEPIEAEAPAVNIPEVKEEPVVEEPVVEEPVVEVPDTKEEPTEEPTPVEEAPEPKTKGVSEKPVAKAEPKAKKSKKTTKKAKADTKREISLNGIKKSLDIVCDVDKIPEDALKLSVTCNDFVFFAGSKVAIVINPDYANDFGKKDEILKRLDAMGWYGKDNTPVSLYNICCGTSKNMDIFAPFSEELAIPEGATVIEVRGIR